MDAQKRADTEAGKGSAEAYRGAVPARKCGGPVAEKKGGGGQGGGVRAPVRQTGWLQGGRRPGAGWEKDGFRGAARTKPRRGPGKTGCENPAAHLSRQHAGRWSAARGKRGRALAGRKEIVYNFQ